MKQNAACTMRTAVSGEEQLVILRYGKQMMSSVTFVLIPQIWNRVFFNHFTTKVP